MASEVAAAAAPSTSQIATFAPDAENRSAIARPMPRAAPVTMAIRPPRSIRFIASSLSLYPLGTRMPIPCLTGGRPGGSDGRSGEPPLDDWVSAGPKERRMLAGLADRHDLPNSADAPRPSAKGSGVQPGSAVLATAA